MKGSSCNEYESNYYGLLNEILELVYIGVNNKLILFKYKWFDIDKRIRIHPQHGLI